MAPNSAFSNRRCVRVMGGSIMKCSKCFGEPCSPISPPLRSGFCFSPLSFILLQMAWFKRDRPKIEDQADDEERKVKTEGIFVKCPECDNSLYKGELQESLQVCTHCVYHFRISSLERLEILSDDGTFERLDADVTSGDPLE